MFGQGEDFARLVAQARALRAPHALLLVGGQGRGKSHALAVLAQALLCEAPGGEAACGTCAACRKVAQDGHPDLHSVGVPEGKKDIPVEEVRALESVLRLAPAEGRARVARIDPADRLNEEGQNALLKTLEEPRANTFLLLAARSAETLLATVRSRVQVVEVLPLREDQVRMRLRAAGIEAGDDEFAAAVLARGSLGLALDLLNPPARALAGELATFLAEPGSAGALGLVRAWLGGGEGRREVVQRAHLVLTVVRVLLEARLESSVEEPAARDAWIALAEGALQAERDLELGIAPEVALLELFTGAAGVTRG